MLDSRSIQRDYEPHKIGIVRRVLNNKGAAELTTVATVSGLQASA